MKRTTNEAIPKQEELEVVDDDNLEVIATEEADDENKQVPALLPVEKNEIVVDDTDVVKTYKKILPGKLHLGKGRVVSMGQTISCTQKELGSFLGDFVCLSQGKQEARLPNTGADKRAPETTIKGTAVLTENGQIQTRKKHMYEIQMISRGVYDVVNKQSGKKVNSVPLTKAQANELYNGFEE